MDINEKVRSVPEKPGIYIFRDADGRIIYVGKARILRSRVKSYFQKTADLDDRKAAMIRNVADIEFTVTMNELEALILEANLIKQYKPRYNILLRDDKSYPYIKLTISDKWPRLEVVRRILKDGARYFGPYVPAGAMRRTLAFIGEHYRIPDCRHDLNKRMRPCIQFQIGKCIGPCSGQVDHEGYIQTIKEIEMLLEGRNRALIKSLEGKMFSLSEEMRYEEAALVRDRIAALRHISEAQKIISPDLGDADVIGYARQNGTIVFKTLFIRNGMMIGARHFILKQTSGESIPYLIKNFIEQLYSREIIAPPELLLQEMPEDPGILSEWLAEKRGSKVSLAVPRRGLKSRLIRMASDNAVEILKASGRGPEQNIPAEVASLLFFEKPPVSIGAFDISNISGQSAVGAFILWEDGQFNKSGYRHVRMDAVSGPDDYAMIKETVRRVFSLSGQKEAEPGEMRKERTVIPDMIIIDGGREHLNAALDALSEMPDLKKKAVISIAKDPDRVFMPGAEGPIPIDDSRPAALFLRKVRDEVHRFAITTHKRLRSKRTFESALDSIYGLGRRKRFLLLDRFGSIDAIRKALPEEIAALKGFTLKLASDVLNTLNAEGKKEDHPAS